jgi:hypothetical protein
MAQGTITILSRVELGDGNKLFKVSFPGDTAYPTGGTLKAAVTTALQTAIKTVAAAAGDANVRAVEDVTIFDVIPGDCGQYIPSWVTAGLKVRDGGDPALAEVGPATPLNGTTFNVTFVCY